MKTNDWKGLGPNFWANLKDEGLRIKKERESEESFEKWSGLIGGGCLLIVSLIAVGTLIMAVFELISDGDYKMLLLISPTILFMAYLIKLSSKEK
ncbi:hypothetical protein CO058_00580 [candidate division WWE3 bacterium CG_4_9_14_0_2_um_filter_35_11]|uniref:Uncharacterized protein n=1 Tax=candidate division WWE3 bacterium CG_4_9_14_0_2_um_filter_35_11 TaxID=1975077 RepID=A0A2M8EMK3_UNCKA|nr:MAG: hypothetical protein COV25_01395 [candidate division WWE3 bacterium CG10_big_fil_rev_8_21_14_0_10_35_32]PJC23972.1 MAG: hypothetical protein CO058_00580 [candidate division WWE3 bacterium CG_4_9_14_0_2_um_filter_35_11]